ncbi:MAG: CHAP domain-containing protein [Candidatus Obscuribacter phosphatis]|uniref:CHAP domain-containing protein n=1 Tax=Candidatus Obscuribacter phosphatis TaxID=1906157 RepID=A0A8J7TLM4_9BACT|nr:CHAP domain-containing protein [Candidatus Obscuribacter phosphatis]
MVESHKPIKFSHGISAGSLGGGSMDAGADASDSTASTGARHARGKFQADSLNGRRGILEQTNTTDNTAPTGLHGLTITEGALSPKKSLDDLAKAGVIADSRTKETTNVGDGKSEPRPITSFEKPKIEVGFTDTLEQQGKKPDLIVRADGKVEMLNNPEILSSGNVVVGLERAPGAVNPTEAQQKSVGELYKYLDARIKEQNPALAGKGVDLENPQGLVPEEAAAAARRAGQRANVPDGADAGSVQSGNRYSGNRAGGRMSSGEVSDMFPGRDFRSRNGQVDAVDLIKDTVSSLNGSRGNHEHFGYRRGRGHAVGAYGLTADHFQNWLANLDIEALEEQERKGLVPPGTAARMKKLKEQVAKGETPDVLKKMRDTDQNSLSDADKKDILGTFGKEVQELAAKDLINGYSKTIAEQNPGKEVDPGQIALAMHLGRVPNAEDMADSGNKDYMSAARNKWQLAAAATQSRGEGFDWSGDANGIVAASQNADGQRMWTRFAASVKGGRLGCAASVSEVLINAGYNVTPDAGAHNLAMQLLRKGGEKVSINQVRPGDVVFGGPGRAGGSDHIGIVERVDRNGNIYVGANSSSRGRWVSDQPLMSAFGRFVRGGQPLYGIRLPGSDTNNSNMA